MREMLNVNNLIDNLCKILMENSDYRGSMDQHTKISDIYNEKSLKSIIKKISDSFTTNIISPITISDNYQVIDLAKDLAIQITTNYIRYSDDKEFHFDITKQKLDYFAVNNILFGSDNKLEEFHDDTIVSSIEGSIYLTRLKAAFPFINFDKVTIADMYLIELMNMVSANVMSDIEDYVE